MFDTLDTLDEVCDDDGVLATSSPRNTSIESPADKIVKSVGRVQFMSPLSTDRLYPRIEVVDNNTNKTVPTESDNQLPSSKRRNDGSSTMNSLTNNFSESLSKFFNDDDIIVAKRRCEFGVVDTNMMDIQTEISTPGTPSLLSDHDGTFSLTSNSFTFYQPPINEPCHDVNSTPLSSNGFVDCVEFQDSNEFEVFEEPKESPHTYTFTQSPPVHTISTYRKQQQLRLPNNKMKTKEKYEKLEPPKNNYNNEEENQALKITADRLEILGKIIKEQNNMIEHAKDVLDLLVKKEVKISDLHVHTERLLLIANLKRTDAELEMQRLRYEHNLSPTGIAGGFHLRPPGNGKRLVIDSLRIPLLTAVSSTNNSTKNKASHKTIRSITKWPKEIRYFVCVIRATATVYRPSITTATRPVDAIDESNYRFTLDNHIPYNELGYGYVEFIIRPNDNSGRRCPDSESAPIIIDGLDNSGWKITVELYGLYPTESGNSTDNKKKHGYIGVRTTMFRQLANFEFSSSEVARKQFTLNNVYQSESSTIDEPEVARICMEMLEDGEEYIQRHVKSNLNGSILSKSHAENLVIKSLKLPPECKLTEGFITLFDDFALRIPIELAPKEISKWQHFLKYANKKSKTLFTRLWFKVEIINDPNITDYNAAPNEEVTYPQTIVLKYWLLPEHAEQDQEPVGIIDLSGCLPLERTKVSEHCNIEFIPAARPFLDTSDLPNAMRLQFAARYQIHNALLAFETINERDEWCTTINGAVDAIDVHQSQFIEYRQLTTKKK